jgi:hypothetical protein
MPMGQGATPAHRIPLQSFVCVATRWKVAEWLPQLNPLEELDPRRSQSSIISDCDLRRPHSLSAGAAVMVEDQRKYDDQRDHWNDHFDTHVRHLPSELEEADNRSLIA